MLHEVGRHDGQTNGIIFIQFVCLSPVLRERDVTRKWREVLHRRLPTYLLLAAARLAHLNSSVCHRC